MDKDKLLQALNYLRDLPPSKWSLLIITKFKLNVLDHLIEFVEESEEKDIYETAKKIFKNEAE